MVLFSDLCKQIDIQNQVEKWIEEIRECELSMHNIKQRMEQDKLVIAHLKNEKTKINVWTCSAGALFLLEDSSQVLQRLEMEWTKNEKMLSEYRKQMEKCKKELQTIDPYGQYRRQYGM